MSERAQRARSIALAVVLVLGVAACAIGMWLVGAVRVGLLPNGAGWYCYGNVTGSHCERTASECDAMRWARMTPFVPPTDACRAQPAAWCYTSTTEQVFSRASWDCHPSEDACHVERNAAERVGRGVNRWSRCGEVE